MILRCICVLLLPILVYSQAKTFCGNIEPADAAGAKGWFQMNMMEGEAQYAYSVDLTNFDISVLENGAEGCDLSQGLSWHIHSYWDNNQSTSAAGPGCDMTGGHYDPTFLCSNSSEYAGSLCTDMQRTWADGYKYLCIPIMYENNIHSFCELGDLSGKFGTAMETHSGSRKFQHTDLYTDLLPPFWVNYQNSWPPYSIMWRSIVFHCASNGARLACADIVEMPLGVNVCESDAEVFDQLNELDWCIAVTTAFVLLYGVYYKLTTPASKPAAGSAHKYQRTIGTPSNHNLDEDSNAMRA